MPDILIVRINKVGWLTLSGLGLDLAAFYLLVEIPSLAQGSSFAAHAGRERYFFLALGLMYLGMLTDAFDGILARKYGMESEFGRYLDGFVDVFNYLVLPNLALWKLGFQGPLAALVLAAMTACGILRLSKFNMMGTVKKDGESRYLGLPVFWSQLLLFPLYLAFALAPAGVFIPLAAMVWCAMSAAFLLNRTFFKPKNAWLIAGLTLALSAGGFAGFFSGMHP